MADISRHCCRYITPKIFFFKSTIANHQGLVMFAYHYMSWSNNENMISHGGLLPADNNEMCDLWVKSPWLACGVTIWVSVGTNLDCYGIYWDMALKQRFPINGCWWLCNGLLPHWIIYNMLWTNVVSGNFYRSLKVTDSPLAQPLRQTGKPPVCKGTVKKPSAVLLVIITQKVCWYLRVADNMLTLFLTKKNTGGS